MRTIILITLAYSVTGCSSRCRLPFLRGGHNLNVTSCERKGNELHVTVQQPCEPQAACLPGKACGKVNPGVCGPTCRALTMDWAHLPIPIIKIKRVPACRQVVVDGCVQPGQVVPGYAPGPVLREPPVSEQPVPAPHPADGGDTVRALELENRARQLEDQVDRLRDVLNRRQTGASNSRGHIPSRTDVPILPPPPQRWGPEDGVPGFTQSPIEQLSGTSPSRSAFVEPWPYSPQNPHRRAGR